ncbi:MAG TPA: hypothetical protein VJK02_24695 [Anaerolineales bacterium]|nr:hypothetical protein [Anaerolineales bacterium]
MSTEDLAESTRSARWENLRKLGEDWSKFLRVVLSPPVVVLATLALFMLWQSLSSDETTAVPPLVKATLTLLMSVFSGLLGALISGRWREITEQGVLVARGKSAIRALRLLLSYIGSMERRILSLSHAVAQLGNGNEVIGSGLDEQIDRCGYLQEATIAAIEEWQDVIPDAANLGTQIGLISEMKGKELLLQQEVSNLRNELEQAKEQSAGEADRLRGDLGKKEAELSRVESKLRDLQTVFNRSVLAGSSLGIRPAADSLGTGSSRGLSIFEGMGAGGMVRVCPRCRHASTQFPGKPFVCPNCRYRDAGGTVTAGQ